MQQIKPTVENQLWQIKNREFYPVFDSMTRAERRSVKGRLLLAEAELKTTKAQNEFLKGLTQHD